MKQQITIFWTRTDTAGRQPTLECWSQRAPYSEARALYPLPDGYTLDRIGPERELRIVGPEGRSCSLALADREHFSVCIAGGAPQGVVIPPTVGTFEARNQITGQWPQRVQLLPPRCPRCLCAPCLLCGE